MIQFTRKILRVKDYRGSNGAKWYTDLNGKSYNVKSCFRDKISHHRRHKKFRRPNNVKVSGYDNYIYSEYVASNVINFLNFNGVKSHNVSLGVDNNNKIYNFCEDFRYFGLFERYNFVSIYDIKRLYYIKIDYKSIEGVLKYIEEQKYIDSKIMVKYFWSMFMLDALNLNRDRHIDNWGLLYDPLSKIWKTGKVYDNGSSLLAKGDLKEVLMVTKNPANYYNNETIKVLHSLKEKRESHNRLNYREFLSTTNNNECLETLKEFYEFLNMDWLMMFIDTLELNSQMKEHYKNIYKSSYELIIKYAYENNPNIQK